MIRKIFKSVSLAFVAQIIALMVSVFMSFYVSKFMTVESYGYYQLFLFLTTYVGILQFGVSEGNYLESGGKTMDDLDHLDLRNQFISTSLVQAALLGIIFLGISLFVSNPDKHIVFIFGIASCVIYLWNYFFGFQLQAVNQTEKYSLATIIGKLLTLALFIVAVVMKKDSYVLYTVIYVVGWAVSGLIVAIYARKILTVKGRFEFNLLKHKKTLFAGNSLLYSGLISSFIIGINRIYIDNVLGIEAFGKVSMALSFCNLLVLFAIQVGMVMFPNVMNLPDTTKKKVYYVLNALLPYLTPAVIIVYFPLGYLLERWLPNYVQSVHWIILFVPYMVYEIKNQFLYYTYLKTMRQEKYMFRVNVFAFLLCAVVNLAIILLTRNIEYMFIVINLVIILKTLLLEKKVSSVIDKRIHVFCLIEAAICIISTGVMYYYSGVMAILICVALYLGLLIVQKKQGMLQLSGFSLKSKNE